MSGQHDIIVWLHTMMEAMDWRGSTSIQVFGANPHFKFICYIVEKLKDFVVYQENKTQQDFFVGMCKYVTK